MKHGKNPTREQKKWLWAQGINPADWMVSKDTTTQMVLVNRHFESRTKVLKKQET